MEILTSIRGITIPKHRVKNLPYNAKLKPLLSGKRKAGILCEVLFWRQVHRGIFHGIDFDRQRIIGNYIVDFYVKDLGLVVEIDGWIHDYTAEYDKKRQVDLELYGLHVFRVSNHDILYNMMVVLKDLEDFIILKYGIKNAENNNRTE